MYKSKTLIILIILIGAAIALAWTSYTSRPHFSFEKFTAAISNNSCEDFINYCSVNELSKNLTDELFSDPWLHNIPDRSLSFSFSLAKKAMSSNLSKQIFLYVCKDKAIPADNEKTGSADATEAMDMIKSFATNTPSCHLARVLTDSSNTPEPLLHLLQSYGITKANFHGVAYEKEYNAYGKVFTGRYCNIGLKFFSPRIKEDIIVELKWKRNRDTSALPYFEHRDFIPFNTEGWHLEQISNLNELVSKLEPEFKDYLKSIASGPPDPTYEAITNKGKSVLTKIKQWFKK